MRDKKSIVLAVLILLFTGPLALVSQVTQVGGSGGGGLTQAAADLRYLQLAGGTITGQLNVASGTAADPGIEFTPGEGIHSVANNTLSFSIAGGEAVRFDSGAIGTKLNLRMGASAAALDVGLDRIRAGEFVISDGTTGGGSLRFRAITAPAAPSGGATMYLDAADSDLKIKYADGTVVTIGDKP